MAKTIVDFEARRVNGKLAIYSLPANDGGGAYEVAGINVRYHPVEAAKLKALIEAGRHDQAEASVVDYLLDYTKPAAGWTTDAGVEFYLRDCVFNRGPKGAARILQRALGVDDDGEIGPATRDALSRSAAEQLLNGAAGGARGLRARGGRLSRQFLARSGEPLGQGAGGGAGVPERAGRASARRPPDHRDRHGGGVAGYAFWDFIAAHPVLSALIIAGIARSRSMAGTEFKAWREQAAGACPLAPAATIIKEI